MVDAQYNFNIQKIQDTVWVFKNAIQDAENILEYFKNNREWSDWYTFGKHAPGTHFAVTFDNFPTIEEWEDKKNSDPNDFSKRDCYENKINDLFYNCTKLYIESNNIDLPNWGYTGWNIAKYEQNTNDEFAMMYHTDFQRDIAYSPGFKFAVTCVMYLNDDYDGGEVLFRFLDDDLVTIKEDYDYKPSAGDIVVFMSGHPHYHGVRSISSGEKYMIRTYWRYDYPGHPLWLKLQEKYGPDIWNQMEEDRLRFNRNSKNINIVNNIPFYLDFEEYYKKEIEPLNL